MNDAQRIRLKSADLTDAQRASKSRRLTFPALAVLMLLAGCTINLGSGSSSPSGGSENSVSADRGEGESQTPPQEMTLEESGARYLEIINDVNCTVRRIFAIESENSLGDGTTDPAFLGEIQDLYGLLSDARVEAVRALVNEDWPESVATEVDLIARDWSVRARAERDASNAPDLGAFNLVVQGFSSLPSEGNPGYLRTLLGVGTNDETDRC